MPQYTFTCPNGHTFSTYAPAMTRTLFCAECGESARRNMPRQSGNSETLEKVDAFTGKQFRTDLRDMVTERNSNHYWQVEVPRLVASGEYALDVMLSNGWVYYNDKGELETRTKPPTSD